MPDRKEQRELDAQLAEEIRILAAARQIGLNELVAALLRQGLAAGA